MVFPETGRAVGSGREVGEKEGSLSLGSASALASLEKAVWQGVFAGLATSQASLLILGAKGSFLIRTSITLSICSKRIQLL